MLKLQKQVGQQTAQTFKTFKRQGERGTAQKQHSAYWGLSSALLVPHLGRMRIMRHGSGARQELTVAGFLWSSRGMCAHYPLTTPLRLLVQHDKEIVSC